MTFIFSSANSASLISRIFSIFLGVVVGAGVIGAAVAVGVIVSRESNAFRNKAFISQMKIVLSRPITPEELDEFFDKYQTLDDLDRSVAAKIAASFPDSHLKTIIVFMVEKPILVHSASSGKATDARPSIVTLNATNFFKTSINGSQIRRAMGNYSDWITLKTIDGEPSRQLAPILLNESIFTDAVLSSLIEEEAKKQISITFPPSTLGYNTTGSTITINRTTMTHSPNTSSTTSSTTTDSSSTTSSTTTESTSTTSSTTTDSSSTTSSTTTESTSTTSSTTTESTTTIGTPALISNCSGLFESSMAAVFQYWIPNTEANLSYYDAYIWSQLDTIIRRQLIFAFPTKFIKLESFGGPNRTRSSAIRYTDFDSENSSIPTAYTFLSIGYFKETVTAIAIRDSLINTTASLPIFNVNQTNFTTAYFSPRSSYFTTPVLRENRTMIINRLINACRSASSSVNTTLNSSYVSLVGDTTANCQSFYRCYSIDRKVYVYRPNYGFYSTFASNSYDRSNITSIVYFVPNITNAFWLIESLSYHVGIIGNLTGSGTGIVLYNQITRCYTNMPITMNSCSSIILPNTIFNSSALQNYSYIAYYDSIEYPTTFNIYDPC